MSKLNNHSIFEMSEQTTNNESKSEVVIIMVPD